MYHILCQSVEQFDSVPRHLNLGPPNPPPPPPNAPGVLWGELYLAYIHSQTNPPTGAKFGSNRNRCSPVTASPDLEFVIPYPPPPPNYPLGY